jgi:diguanylate cyclase (GGDEF)-like protein
VASNSWPRNKSTSADSFFDLLGETLSTLDRGVRGEFLSHFFKAFAQIELSPVDSAAAWDLILERHAELSRSTTRPITLNTAIIDVLENMNLLRVPIFVEYQEFTKLRVNAATDALTGLYNRRLFEDYFQKELSRSKRLRQQLALVIMDLHRFKQVNDRYGHQQGDQALKLAATAAMETVRTSDYTFRIGGDEFAILLPQCDQEQCAALTWRLRARFEAAVKDLFPGLPLTLDFGISVFPSDGEQREVLIRAADMRLYDMKKTESLLGGQPARESREIAASDASSSRPAAVSAEVVPDEAMLVPESPGADFPRELEEESHRNKRKWERVAMSGTSAHIVWDGGAQTTTPVIDVSYGGIAVLVENSETFPQSLQAVLHMPIQLPVSVSLRKSYEQHIQGSGTRVGCAFVM